MRKANQIGITALFLCFLLSSNSRGESCSGGAQFTAFRFMMIADEPAEATEAPVVLPKKRYWQVAGTRPKTLRVYS